MNNFLHGFNIFKINVPFFLSVYMWMLQGQVHFKSPEECVAPQCYCVRAPERTEAQLRCPRFTIYVTNVVQWQVGPIQLTTPH